MSDTLHKREMAARVAELMDCPKSGGELAQENRRFVASEKHPSALISPLKPTIQMCSRNGL